MVHRRNNRNVLVERERQIDAREYERALQEKQELWDRKRQKPISVGWLAACFIEHCNDVLFASSSTIALRLSTQAERYGGICSSKAPLLVQPAGLTFALPYNTTIADSSANLDGP